MGMDVLLVHMDADDRLVAGQMLAANSLAISSASSGVTSPGLKDWMM